MSQNFRRFRHGEHWNITEPTANAIIEVAENWAKHRLDPTGVDPLDFTFQGNVVEVFNNAGQFLPRFAVGGLKGTFFNPGQNLAEFQSQPRFSLETPIPNDTSRFCVTIEPIAVGQVGLAVVSGVVPCMVQVFSGKPLPSFADIIVGQVNYLQGSNGGAAVLWCDTLGPQSPNYVPGYGTTPASGTPWAYIRIPQSSVTSVQDFELLGDLTPGNYAAAYPMKTDGTGPDLSQATFSVYDAPEGCRRAWGRTTMGTSGLNHGARGKAYLNSGTSTWEILSIQALSETIKVSIGSSGVAAAATFSSTALDVMDEGQDPSKGTGVLAGIQNGSVAIPANTTGIVCLWDQGLGKYLADYQAGSAALSWGIVQSTPTNQSGATSLAVSVKSCNPDGSGVTGTAFNVYTPILSARDTSLFTGDVVAYVPSSGANPYTIVSDCFDDPLGTLRLLYTTTSRVPNGWSDVTAALTGYFPMVDTAANASQTHTGDQHDHVIAFVEPQNGCIATGGTSYVANFVPQTNTGGNNYTTTTGGSVVTAPAGDVGNNFLKPPNVSVRAIYRSS
jgi:hypothetical protein